MSSACLAGFAVAASAPLATPAAAATAARPAGLVEADAIAPAATTSSGIPIGLAILVIGGTVLAALFVYLVGRAIRGSSGSTSSGMRAASRRDASTDAWREAGRRHPVPPRASDPTDDGGPNDRFG